MAFVFNGLNYSYSYEELIEELKMDIDDGLIKPTTIINIVRKPESAFNDLEYYPIIDYYFDSTIASYGADLEDVFNKDEFTDEEWADMVKERLATIEQYEKDKENMSRVTATTALTEMEMWNLII